MQDELQALFLRCDRALESLAGIFDPAELEQARADVLELREHRQFNRMLRLAEAVSRVDPDDARNRRLQAQALIETGLATVAVPLLESIVRSVGPDDPEALEAQGLLGRAWKQIFFDAGDRSMPGAQKALRCAVEAYRAPYAANPKNCAWHGVNLLAVLHRARWMGLKLDDTDIRALARNLLKVLDEMPERGRRSLVLGERRRSRARRARPSAGGACAAQLHRLGGPQAVPGREHAAPAVAAVGTRPDGRMGRRAARHAARAIAEARAWRGRVPPWRAGQAAAVGRRRPVEARGAARQGRTEDLSLVAHRHRAGAVGGVDPAATRQPRRHRLRREGRRLRSGTGGRDAGADQLPRRQCRRHLRCPAPGGCRGGLRGGGGLAQPVP